VADSETPHGDSRNRGEKDEEKCLGKNFETSKKKGAYFGKKEGTIGKKEREIESEWCNETRKFTKKKKLQGRSGQGREVLPAWEGGRKTMAHRGPSRKLIKLVENKRPFQEKIRTSTCGGAAGNAYNKTRKKTSHHGVRGKRGKKIDKKSTPLKAVGRGSGGCCGESL